MHLDPVMPLLVAAIFAILLVGFLSQRLRVPYVVTYLIVGVGLGPFGLGLITDISVQSAIGAGGVVLLLFFVGMEISLKRLISDWKIALLGTAVQIGLSVAFLAGVEWVLEWGWARVVLLGFVISLSSTAVVLKLLQDWGRQTVRWVAA